MRFSKFGDHLKADSGILGLMQDIDAAMTGPDPMLLLGGGNPARIPAVQEVFRSSMQQLLNDGDRFESIGGSYDGAKGDSVVGHALATLFQKRFGWDIGPENVAITNGSQSSFYILFHLFAGEYRDYPFRKILLPLTPEYIGYSDIGMGNNLFRSYQPAIELQGNHEFKYHVDFERLTVDDDIGAIAVSRPTNPTGNVLSDSEIAKLRALARSHDIPLILDSAYGAPFPNIVFPEVTTDWDENTILCLSLSKLGLPGLRTGFVVANEEVIRAISGANAIMALAPGSTGPGLTRNIIEDGRILDISNDLIRPYYKAKVQDAMTWVKNAMHDLPCRIHSPEGAIFLWLWFEGLPITSELLYQRLKARGVLVVSGEHFFPGLSAPWSHRQECIRVSYAQDPLIVKKGIEVIAEEVRRAFQEIK